MEIAPSFPTAGVNHYGHSFERVSLQLPIQVQGNRKSVRFQAYQIIVHLSWSNVKDPVTPSTRGFLVAHGEGASDAR